ncbi:MAG: hypothetical protein JXN60_06255 [Lentisphaerae bacterium]|nr:hypothetical protein [Lentisphaerota bacterium]
MTITKNNSVGNTTCRSRRTLCLGAMCFVVALVLALVLAEISLRARQYVKYGTGRVPGWLHMGEGPIADWHPFLRTVPKAPADWLEVQGNNSAVISINSLGFRSPAISLKKPSGTFRVACVGGSAVYDTRVSMDQTWAVQLQDALQKCFPDRVFEVVNAGIPSRTTADTIVNLALRVLPIDPDVVIVMHGINDQKPNRYPGFKDDYSHWYPPPVRAYVNFWHRIIDRSLLGSHIRYRLLFVLNPARKDNWRGEKLKRYDTVEKAGLNAYRRNIESIIGMCRIHGVEVVIATVGHSLKENADWNPGMGTRNPLVYYHECLTFQGIENAFMEYNRINREVAAEQGCVLVDIERLLPEGKEHYQDDVHFNSKGSRLVAELFAREVPWKEWIRGRKPQMNADGRG